MKLHLYGSRLAQSRLKIENLFGPRSVLKEDCVVQRHACHCPWLPEWLKNAMILAYVA